MDRKAIFMIGISAIVCVCCNESVDISSNSCKIGEKLYEGKCYDKNVCLPECDEDTQKCVQGTCYAKTECVPKCDEDTEKCVDGNCMPLSECYPACDPDTHVCKNGTCERIDPTACAGKMCKNSSTYCDDSGHWADCPLGTGCHLGYCLKGLGPECEDNTCDENGTRECQGGTWVSCGSLETCTEGKCRLQDDSCEPGSCSEDATYRCTDEGTYKECPPGTACTGGFCNPNVEPVDSLLWKKCESNADCPRGVCVFELSASRTMSISEKGLINVDTIALSDLDSRIEPGTGVCSADCTRDAAICENISTDLTKYTCQVVAIGDSPYPPKDEYFAELSLPFHKQLNADDMSVAPYASICRPNDPKEKVYSNSFCKSCDPNNGCDGSLACIHGMCLQPCSDSAQCPFSFQCFPVEGLEYNYCIPPADTCDACLDRDGDGQGYGACQLSGFDCDDVRNDVYYKKILNPQECTDIYTDNNCNGAIDYLEQIGTPDNCDSCGSTCKVDPEASHIDRQCVLNNGGLVLDDSSITSVAETYIYTCENYCELGYADCDSDISNGCETKLFDVDESGLILTDAAERYSLDNDRDGHGVMRDSSMHYCCKSNEDICYALKETDTNAKSYWDRAILHEGASYSTVIDDCDDENDARYPGNKELCDGQDNDCNPETPDGADVFVKLSNYTYVGADESDSNKLKLGDGCVLYNPEYQTKCSDNGIITCNSFSDGIGTSYQMICKADTTQGDGNVCAGNIGEDCCNNRDDNCNGQIDEDYALVPCAVPGAVGICAMGVKVCAGGEQVCQPLYTARTYDFFGDGVDSNCDGVDWDMTHAIFVDKYGSAKYNGNDNHSGKPQSPVATLAKAFTLAAIKNNSKTIFYNDILVDKDVGTFASGDSLWGKQAIEVPTVPVSDRFNPNLKPATSISASLKEDSELNEFHWAHVEAYKAKLRGESAYISYNANDYLYPGEVYPGKEVVRIIGGFENDKGEWEDKGGSSSYEYGLNHLTASVSNNVFTANHYELVRPTGSASMSLRLKRMVLSMSSDGPTGKLTGTTFTGLTCGKNGCDRLILDNSTITVQAPSGSEQDSSLPSNQNWDTNGRNGVDGNQYELGDGGGTNHTVNYWANNCMSNYYQDNAWKVYSDFNASYYNYKCPDGRTPRGGCGASHRCKHGDDYAAKSVGRDGLGYYPGKGAVPPSVNKSTSCDNDQSVDNSQPKGGVGSNGPGGAGGSNKQLDIRFDFANDGSLYMATYSNNRKDSIEASNGSPGTSGGGGGGGGVYHCYDLNLTRDHWCHAGSGGAGGCGGYGGKGGGTGGSAIGLMLTPPKTGTAYFDSIKSSVEVKGAVGGKGTGGQNGIAGGKGGKAFGWAEKIAAISYHCIKGTAGGAGGAGGGGGGGAAGLAGHAYGYLFVCNRNVFNFSSIDDDLKNCGFNISTNFYNEATTTSVETGKDGADGAAGIAGSWNTNHNNSLSGINDVAGWESNYGAGGTGGSSTISDNRTVAKPYHLVKTNAF